jgi:hypothetical protein
MDELPTDILIFACPHCDGTILVQRSEINCQIFRHGIYRNGGEQINPHASKIECDRLYNDELVYGCAKPFKLEIEDGKWKIIVCDYI